MAGQEWAARLQQFDSQQLSEARRLLADDQIKMIIRHLLGQPGHIGEKETDYDNHRTDTKDPASLQDVNICTNTLMIHENAARSLIDM